MLSVNSRKFLKAVIAQLVEQLLCKQQVIGSNPSGGSATTQMTGTSAAR